MVPPAQGELVSLVLEGWGRKGISGKKVSEVIRG